MNLDGEPMCCFTTGLEVGMMRLLSIDVGAVLALVMEESVAELLTLAREEAPESEVPADGRCSSRCCSSLEEDSPIISP